MLSIVVVMRQIDSATSQSSAACNQNTMNRPISAKATNPSPQTVSTMLTLCVRRLISQSTEKAAIGPSISATSR